MRDIKLIVTDDEDLDIDIVNGEPVWLEAESETDDQRAAVAAYMSRGTVPGMSEIGVDWAEKDIIRLNNDVIQRIGAVTTRNYTPIFNRRANSGRVEVQIIRS